jgi:hypothetical protein
MNGLKEGQRMKYQEDGRVFEITKIARDSVILRAVDDPTQILTGKASLDSLFERIPPGDSQARGYLGGPVVAAFSERRGTEAAA